MAYINVSAPTKNAIIQISTATTAIASTNTGYTIGALQDVTINNAAGVFNWTQLDVFSQLAVSTPATNSISANLVLDSATFFGTADVVSGSNGTPSLFALSNDAAEIQFRVYFDGVGAGSKFISGSGYITNLAPTVNPTAPVWVSPITISVNGDLTAGTV
tara:strand:- start:1185 stop:1664 length:480 start_codon:yes stop_codon:yes gene_type:complete